MAEVDLARLPRGELGWGSLLAYVESLDDRLERYFLEVKSDVDLTSKAGRAKVAKFVLGAANRDPVKAAKRFDGHALMVLGVGGTGTRGIPAFEAKDLAQEVQRLIGADGPGWDFERIAAQDDRDIVVVVVDPPTGDVWTCRADGAGGLTDGAIYLRDDGSTRQATGDEIRQLVERARAVSNRPEIALEVAVFGAVVAASGVDEQLLVEEIEANAARLIEQVDPKPLVTDYATAAGLLGDRGFIHDRRSKSEFRDQVEAWRALAVQEPRAGVAAFAAKVLEGVQLRITNLTKTYLRDVRIELEFEAPVLTLDWDDRLERGERINLLPGGIPKNWGEDSLSAAIALTRPSASSVVFPRDHNGKVFATAGEPGRLTVTLRDLRPEDVFTSDDDDVILLMWSSSAPPEMVTARWRLTAADVDDVFTGTTNVAVEHRDWGDAVADALHPPLADEPAAD